jgi:hypothetical protein
MQGTIGSLVAGSPIAIVQSLGASGFIVAVGTAATTVSVAAGVIYGGFKLAEHLRKAKSASEP